MMWERRIGAVGWALTAAAVLVVSTPMPALAQRGLSNTGGDAVTADATTELPAAQRPMQGMQRMQEMQRGQGMRQGRGMPQPGESMTERERLEQMREHMVSGMRRMAVRMAAIQDRLAALDRGNDGAPPVEGGGRDPVCGQNDQMKMNMGQGQQRMGMGQGMQRGQGMQDGQGMGQGMQMRDGTGPGCPAAPDAPEMTPSPQVDERGGGR